MWITPLHCYRSQTGKAAQNAAHASVRVTEWLCRFFLYCIVQAPSGQPGRRPPPIPEGMMQLVYLASCSVLLFREDAFSQLRHVGADKFAGGEAKK